MKWIGQHIWDLTSRFRNDIYFEGLAETEETRGLVVDANGKVSINPLSGDEHATHIYENVRNDEGATIPVGTPVYSKGEIGGSERIKVGIAKASDPTRMPAIGITNTELAATGDTKDGLITIVGVYNTNLSGFSGVSENDVVYVASGGGLTITKPTGVNLIQNVGIVLKTNGPGTIIQGLQVTCIGRTNDVPTPLYIDHTNQRVGIGATSPTTRLEIKSSATNSIPFQVTNSSDTDALFSILEDGGGDGRARIYNDAGTLNVNLDSSGNSYFNGGNVGIGTTSPSQKLHVVGDARIQGNLTVNGTYTQIDTDVNTTEQWLVTNDGTGPAAVINQLGTEDIFDVQDDGTSVFYIEDGGNVGIGTTTPNEKLEVDGNIRLANSGKLYLWQSHDANYLQYYRWELNSSLTAYINNSGSGGVALKTAGNTRLHIDNSGNVGIGTTSPASELDVNGTITLSGDTEHQILKSTSSSYGLGGAETTFVYGRNVMLSAYDDVVLRAGTSDEIRFFAGSSGAARMTIDQNGKVGIGTASPSEKLTIEQTSAGSDVYPLQLSNVSTTDSTGVGIIFNVSSNTAYPNARILVERTDNDATGEMSFWTISGNSGTIGERMRIDKDGNVGIGTSSPSEKLHVFGGAAAIEIDSTTNEASLKYDNSTTTATIKLANNDLKTELGGSEKMRILANGNVGIGTTSPAYKLDVRNSSTLFYGQTDLTDATSIFRIRANGGSSEVLEIEANGNVGIGTASPSEKLEVDGNIKIGDNDVIKIGDGDDLRIQHSSGDSSAYIQNYTGNLNIQNLANDKDIIFQCDDGSGGVETYFYLDGSASSGNPYTIFPDNSTLQLGSSTGYGDLQLLHNGTDSYIQNAFGQLYINQNVNDGDIVLQSDDGSGGITPYLTIDGSATRTNVHKNMLFDDNVTLGIGADYDLQLYHNGGTSLITNQNGNLLIRNQADDSDIIFQADDGSGGDTEYLRIDGGEGRLVHSANSRYLDNVVAMFGTGADLQIYHDATESWINNANGNLLLVQNANDKDIVFYCDDGSGGVTPYLTLDGSSGYTKAHKHILYEDNAKAMFGTGGDMQILHDGSNSYISHNVTGNLYIQNNANGKDIVFQSDDGSGGTTAYLTLDGGDEKVKALKQLQVTGGIELTNSNLNMPDNSRIRLGSSTDLQIYHNGTDSVVDNLAGDFYISQKAADKDLIFRADDGAGGFETYFYLDGSANTAGNPVTLFPDNSLLGFGSGYGDLQLHHNGSHSYVKNRSTGNLYIRQEVNDSDIVFESDDGSGGTTPYLVIDGSAEQTRFFKDTRHTDGIKANFGNSDDLQIYHDGSHSYITDTGSGVLKIGGNQVAIGNPAVNEYYFRGYQDAQVELYYDNSKKLETTSTGVSITGTVSGTTLYGNHPDGNGLSLKLGRADNSNYWEFNHAGNDLRIYNNASSGSHILLGVNAGGTAKANNVGIGTAIPSEKLDVVGNIAVSGSVQRQISTTHHTFTTVNGGSAAQDYWVPFIGTNELAAPNVTHRTIAPYGGILKKAIVHSTAAFGSSAQVRFHRIDNGNASVFTNLNDTDDVTTNVTESLATAYTSTEFIFTTGNTFSTGDQVGVSFVRNNTAQGDVAMTLVWEYELF